MDNKTKNIFIFIQQKKKEKKALYKIKKSN